MIEIAYRNDGKENFDSHEIFIKEKDVHYNEYGLWSHNPFNITGYGSNREEAFKDFVNKYSLVMKDLKAFEKMLHEIDISLCDIIIIDSLGNVFDDDQK
jgi:hypothetical protein